MSQNEFTEVTTLEDEWAETRPAGDITTRPTITDQMVLEAAKKITDEGLIGCDPQQIADQYHYPMNGYELAKALDDRYGWRIERRMLDDLDRMDMEVLDIHQRVCWEWIQVYKITPPLPIGTLIAITHSNIKTGTIDHISKHSPATYAVKITGCQEEGSFRLIQFEDAVVAE